MSLDIIIRDDDINYFTTTSEIDEAYGNLHYNNNVTINFGVVPRIIPSITGCVPSRFWAAKKSYRLGENQALVRYLKDGIKKRKFGIMMHGVTHEYIHVRGVSKPEYFHANYGCDVLRAEREYLENIFMIDIDGFIPPGNYISPKYYEMVSKEFRYLFNVPSMLKSSRNLNIMNVWWWLRRVYSYYFDLEYPHRKRINGYDFASVDLSPTTDYKKLGKRLKGYIKSENRYLIVLATHYWEMGGLDYAGESVAEQFLKFVDGLKEDGVNFLNVNLMNLEETQNEKYTNLRVL